jgi:hypothetical protein
VIFNENGGIFTHFWELGIRLLIECVREFFIGFWKFGLDAAAAAIPLYKSGNAPRKAIP